MRIPLKDVWILSISSRVSLKHNKDDHHFPHMLVKGIDIVHLIYHRSLLRKISSVKTSTSSSVSYVADDSWYVVLSLNTTQVAHLFSYLFHSSSCYWPSYQRHSKWYWQGVRCVEFSIICHSHSCNLSMITFCWILSHQLNTCKERDNLLPRPELGTEPRRVSQTMKAQTLFLYLSIMNTIYIL